MKCPHCKNENEDNAKFCKHCGKQLNTNTEVKKFTNNKKIIIALIGIIIILAVIAVYASGVLTPELELKNQKFEGFNIDVPVESKFVLSESSTTNSKNMFVTYWNDGETFYQVGYFIVGTNVTKRITGPEYELMGSEGDLTIYTNESDGLITYQVFKEGKDANIILYGTDLNTLKRMANSFEDKDFKKLATSSSTNKQTSTSSTKNSESGSWVSIGSYSGSGTGSESITIPAGKIKIEFSAFPIKNYADNYLYIMSSNGESGALDWSSNSAVASKSDVITYTSSNEETFSIDYYETASWDVEVYRYQ